MEAPYFTSCYSVRLSWVLATSYCEIANAYADFTSKHYGSAILVFDGYESGPSIRDNTYQRRGQTTIYPMVNSIGETELEGKNEECLSRCINNQHRFNK